MTYLPVKIQGFGYFDTVYDMSGERSAWLLSPDCF